MTNTLCVVRYDISNWHAYTHALVTCGFGLCQELPHQAVKCGLSSNPEDARAFDILHHEVVQMNSGLPAHLIRVNRILHQEEDVDISGIYFGSHEGPKHDEAGDLPVVEVSL